MDTDKLGKEREAMALKLGLSPDERSRFDLSLLDEFIRIERIEGPIAFYRKQLEVFGEARPRRNEVAICCPNCGNAMTIRLERA